MGRLGAAPCAGPLVGGFLTFARCRLTPRCSGPLNSYTVRRHRVTRYVRLPLLHPIRSAMKLTRLIPMLPVRSMPESLAFYEKLGFSVERRKDQWRWAMLSF